MMDIYFNELSASFDYDLIELTAQVEKYAEVIKEAVNQGFGKVRYSHGIESVMLNGSFPLSQFLFEHQTLQSVKVLLSTQAKPYIPDGDDAEDDYILNDYYVEFCGKRMVSDGFAAATINESMVIGFENIHWDQNSYNVIECGENGERVIPILYTSDSSFFSSEEFLFWSDTHLPPTILPSRILPSQKKIHLSHHHGTDVLEKFAKCIRKEEYIVSIVNSIDRDLHETRFARPQEGTKNIEITLINDGHYGLVVSTTARNGRELRYIAKLIQKKYG